MAGTVGQQRVRRDFLDNYQIPLPTIEEQRRIVDEIKSHENDVARLETSIVEHRESIDNLIDAVWNGSSV